LPPTALQSVPAITIQALLRAEMPVVQHAALFADRKMVGTGLFRPYSILPSGPDWDAVTVVLGAASVGGHFHFSLDDGTSAQRGLMVPANFAGAMPSSRRADA
jgi:hypothetical protein